MRHGFKRFLILNSHGGNAAITKFIVDRINQETEGIAVDLGSVLGPFRTRVPDRGERHLEAMLPEVAAGDPTALAVFLAEGLKDEATGKGTSARGGSSLGVSPSRLPVTC